MAVGISMTATGPYKLWIGDLAGTINDANAIMYVKDNGDAYFGGSLSAGALRNSATSRTVTSNPSVQTPQFGTNGNPKNVSVSFAYNNAGMDMSPPTAGSVGVVLRLERRRNGTGAWTQLGSDMSYTGTITVMPLEPGDGYPWNISLNGSSNFVDNATGTQDFEYRVTRISSSGTWPFLVVNSGYPGTQALTVTSVEN